MLKCENISFDIDGHNLFSNINLNLKNQKDLLITGPSGIGKTTLLSILCGLQKPTSGSIIYNDINLYNLTENEVDKFRGNNLGVVFQNFNLINSYKLSGGKNIEESSKIFLNILKNNGTREQVDAVLANSGLAIYCAKKLPSIKEGIEIARESLESGKAYNCLKLFIENK